MRTIDAVWAKLVAKRLERQGLLATELLQRAEVKPYLLNQKSARMPFHQHAALLDLAARRRRIAALGWIWLRTKATLATTDCWSIRPSAAKPWAKP
jgi:hypothetical protein